MGATASQSFEIPRRRGKTWKDEGRPLVENTGKEEEDARGEDCANSIQLVVGSGNTIPVTVSQQGTGRNFGRNQTIDPNGKQPKEEEDHNQAGRGYDNPSYQTPFNTHKEPPSPSLDWIRNLGEILHVPADDITSEDDPQSLIQKSVCQLLPKPPADLDLNLQQYLLNVQEKVKNELLRLRPPMEQNGLMGDIIGSYHRHIFHHLGDLVDRSSSSKNSLVLIKWVLHTYLSRELLGHCHLQAMDPIKKVDVLLLTEWTEKAKHKLLENVQKEIRGTLEKILQLENSQEDCENEEACIRIYVDTIQCIDAIPSKALNVSLKLSTDVREVCFRELLNFLQRYKSEQTELLAKKAKMETPEKIHFFKTLKTCKELKQYVQSKGEGTSVLKETLAELDNMEAFTLKFLKEILVDFTEDRLKNYFKAKTNKDKDKYEFSHAVKTLFSKLPWCQDVQKGLMDENYKLIAHIYLKHLIRRNLSRLTKYWGPNVGQKVTEDAKVLHDIISDLAPGVQQCNRMLLKIKDLLECESTDGVKVTVAFMQKECLTWRDISFNRQQEGL